MAEESTQLSWTEVDNYAVAESAYTFTGKRNGTMKSVSIDRGPGVVVEYDPVLHIVIATFPSEDPGEWLHEEGMN